MRRRYYAFILAALVFAAVFWLYSRPSGGVTVDFFDVGQGDAILVQSGAAQLLIDGGPDDTVLSELGRVMPFADRDIDYVVLTHPHADHFTGLIGVLARYRVHHIVLSGAANTTPEYHAFERAAADEHADVTIARIGDAFTVGGVRLDVYAPTDDVSRVDDLNAASVVMRLTYGASHIILMGDATAEVEQKLLASHVDLAADVLKVGHHGSRFSSTPAFLDAVHAADAVIEVGKNTYGHPSRQTLARLASRGTRAWRTDRDGSIRAILRGDAVRVCTRSIFCRDKRS